MSLANEKIELDAINIIKGLCFGQLTTEEMRYRLANSPDLQPEEIFSCIDRRSQKKLLPTDISEFLSVHRIAASERECQFLISLNGNPHNHMTFEYFLKYIYCGNVEPPRFVATGHGSRQRASMTGDLLVKNYTERETAKIFEKEIEFYRSLETLKEDFVRNYGYSFQGLYEMITGKSTLDESNLAAFIYRHKDRVDFSHEQYGALCRRITEQGSNRITYQEFAKAFSPFEPINFPIFRKENNLKDALDYVWREVRALNIDTRQAEVLPSDLPQAASKTGFGKTNMSFRRVFDPCRNVNPQAATSAGYFYDKDYFNELKQYRATYFDPNKDYKFTYQEDSRGPQYHDHFFEDYYQYLHERNKSEYFYNKFGKRYTYENPMQMTRKDSRKRLI